MKRRDGINCSYEDCSDPSKSRTSENFGKNRQSPDGLNYVCKLCARLQQKAVDPNKRKASRQRYEQRHSEQSKNRILSPLDMLPDILGFSEKLCTNVDCSLAGVSQPLSDFNRDRHEASTLDYWCKTCRRQDGKARAADRRVAKWAESLYQTAKSSAKRKNIAFTITSTWILKQYQQQEGRCPYFGVSIEPNKENRHPLKPSLDRLNCSVGYTEDNTVVCCLAANAGRNNCSIDTWTVFCKQLLARE